MLALELGREKLYNFYDDLGFGKKTGITLLGETPGKVDFTYRTEIATASFGQGITTTPIQTLQALTILTNGGVEIQPYIVEKIVNSETKEVTYQHELTELGKKASKENINKMLELMYDVVYSGKTDAKFYQTDSVTLIGKTGTAQITGPDGKYMRGKYDYIRSFAGIFPYEDPRYIIYVSVKQYEGNYKEFANMVTKVVEEIAKYKNLNELAEEINENKLITLNNYISTDVLLTEEHLKKLNLNIIKLGNGKFIINQYPKESQSILSGNKVFLLTNDPNYLLPDITGWSSSEVNTLCNLVNLNCKKTGNGKVVSFNIPVNTPINEIPTLEISLSKE